MIGGRSCSSPTDYTPETESFSYPEAFDRAYLADSFTTQPDYALDDWVVPDFFDRPVSRVETPAGFAQKNHAIFNATLPSATTLNPWQTVNPATPFGRSLAFNNDASFPFGNIDNTDSFESSCASPRESSPSLSLCGDDSQISARAASPASSNASLKRDVPEDAADQEEPTPKRVQRKRGRPRIIRTETEADSTGDSPKSRVSRRLPHNQVERKYREGLNSELERLRRAVPTLPQRDSGDLTGPPKPSKATVLASAIDYIKFMETERERLAEENERLRGMRPMRGNGVGGNNRTRPKLQNFGWKGRSNSSASSVLMS
ncbi:hypothetical protein K432DRAFT_359152 [Lepidopterella palustris CBS 459.81]|uniref:BHLH domain-containing protein n=1 Tax=Lepidopterella palustris CBS 459.81 TaxID=1314670 RepID=A0A8E2E4I6_9PEZI|nr:hypothetical protein K432DRAFT_359152 [Lepidopterella palustris CBS 459.81]